jgi:mannose/fructose/N-acetylgalactosamine-specific phosphotransferase system component IIB
MEGEVLNLGGLHLREGRREVLPYLYLDSQEKEILTALDEEGVRVTAQDLPGSPKVGLDSLLA